MVDVEDSELGRVAQLHEKSLLAWNLQGDLATISYYAYESRNYSIFAKITMCLNFRSEVIVEF